MTLTFSFFMIVISFPLFYYFYSYSKENILKQLQNRILSTGKVGIHFLTPEDYKTIEEINKIIDVIYLKLYEEIKNEIKNLPNGETYEVLSEEEHKNLYSKEKVQLLIQKLRKIKAGSTPKMINKAFLEMKFYENDNIPFLRFVYIVTAVPQIPDYSIVKFIADTDMEREDINNNGVIDPDEEAMFIGTLYSVKELVYLQNVFKNQISECENEFYEDEWGTWLSCYIPVLNEKNQLIAVMGLDLDVKSENNQLNNLRNTLIFLLIILVLSISIISLIISKFISHPIEEITKASIQVANKNFDVKLNINSRDEIGILAHNFIEMTKEIKEYSEHLENLVAQRTRELEESLNKVKKLKQQQDGDYYLTSLVMEPLFTNWNKSENVKTDFFIKQKKDFEFKKWKKEIGGDLCITGNLRFRNEKNNSIERWIFFFNGDAMGKSIQGAGGSIVMGALLNGILARSAAKDKVLTITPDVWLKEISTEIQNVYLRFDGHMNISGIMGLLNESDGHVYYLNFDHPKGILYKNGKALFIEEDTSVINYKFGMPLTHGLKTLEFFLEVGDQIIIGSDGKDDLLLENQQINEDEKLILKVIEEVDGDIFKVYDQLQKYGTITDDFSILKVHLIRKTIFNNKQEILKELKKLISQKDYKKIIKLYSNENPDKINIPVANFYIAYSFYKSGELENAIKWLEPIKNKINNKKIQSFVNRIYKLYR